MLKSGNYSSIPYYSCYFWGEEKKETTEKNNNRVIGKWQFLSYPCICGAYESKQTRDLPWLENSLLVLCSA